MIGGWRFQTRLRCKGEDAALTFARYNAGTPAHPQSGIYDRVQLQLKDKGLPSPRGRVERDPQRVVANTFLECWVAIFYRKRRDVMATPIDYESDLLLCGGQAWGLGFPI